MGIWAIEQLEQEAQDKQLREAWNRHYNLIGLDIFTLADFKGEAKAPRRRKPTIGKAKEASKKGKERIDAVEAIEAVEAVLEAELEVRTRAGRAIKKTTKAQKQV
jgi:hypothetical protein